MQGESVPVGWKWHFLHQCTSAACCMNLFILTQLQRKEDDQNDYYLLYSKHVLHVFNTYFLDSK